MPMARLESPPLFTFIGCFLVAAGGWRTMQTWGEHADSTQKSPRSHSSIKSYASKGAFSPRASIYTSLRQSRTERFLKNLIAAKERGSHWLAERFCISDQHFLKILKGSLQAFYMSNECSRANSWYVCISLSGTWWRHQTSLGWSIF